jgi:hypothetical protein
MHASASLSPRARGARLFPLPHSSSTPAILYVMNPLPTSTLSLEQKIWRYMDLTRFVLTLTHQTLFFPCLTQLDDPYEGYMPRSHAEAFSKIYEKTFFGPLANLRPAFEAKSAEHARALDQIIADGRKRISYRENRGWFGVNCWHANDYESEAMWKLYSALGSGVAIESTVERLRDVLAPTSGINIDRVRYENFDSAEIVKGFSSCFLMLKRPSFAHEQEVRATIHLTEQGKGVEVPCNLGRLIVRVHVAPSAPSIFYKAVEELCCGSVHNQRFQVSPSRLLDPPDYDLASPQNA